MKREMAKPDYTRSDGSNEAVRTSRMHLAPHDSSGLGRLPLRGSHRLADRDHELPVGDHVHMRSDGGGHEVAGLVPKLNHEPKRGLLREFVEYLRDFLTVDHELTRAHAEDLLTGIAEDALDTWGDVDVAT